MPDFSELKRHFAATADRPILELFDDPARASDFSVSLGDMRLDYSKTNIDAAGRDMLLALAEAAGLMIDNGIMTDSHGRTSDPAIWAAGDCASFPWRGGRLRLESVQNAIDQAELVAQNVLGAARDYVPMPWFWSDQYDIKLQIAGLNTGYDRVIVRDGGAARSHWYFAGGTLLAVDAMNDPRAFMVGKRLLEAGKSPAMDAVADTGLDLKTLLTA